MSKATSEVLERWNFNIETNSEVVENGLSPEPIIFQLSTSLVDDHPVDRQRQNLRDPTLLLSTAPKALPTHWQQVR
ncbi:hypothetical protein D0Y65_043497 [Glycine soja]|uniref:Mitotic spindle checkpoint protein MAD2 n=1 Tax=Glycine soja TaxID=3848 RepID=A0A445GHN9_GLYSO|nr:hypothetical protein D0Y65_043497 [Glycine soja]